MRSKLKKLIIDFGYLVFKIVRFPIKWYWKRFNIKTYGVRVLVTHKDSLILVRHWYNNLWVMPGGGIKKYETPEQAAIREIREEVGLNLNQLDYKLGTYSNTKEGKNDTVYCFVAELDSQIDIKKKFNIEVSDILWCDFDKLPEGTSKATRERIKEYQNKEILEDIRVW
jgi:8-oxo-dGTP pyrophosphatase MutT (NUDIX family)